MKTGTRDSVLGLVFFGGLALLLGATAWLTDVTWGERQMLATPPETSSEHSPAPARSATNSPWKPRS